MSPDLLYKIAIHEMGHAICGLLTEHDNLIKVSLNLNSPKTPGYTLFESNDKDSSLQTKTKLFSRLMVLLSGRIAEEEFFNQGITTGASHDLEVAKRLAEQMILVYGMGSALILQNSSEKYKEVIDFEINLLLQTAYDKAKVIITMAKPFLAECAKLLVIDHLLLADTIINKMKTDYPHLLLFKK
jgi:ATP-dependent Zn protease